MATPSFGIYARQTREALGLTLRQVGDYVGVHPSSVSRWEAGLSLPAPGHIARLALVLQWEQEERQWAALLLAGLPAPLTPRAA